MRPQAQFVKCTSMPNLLTNPGRAAFITALVLECDAVLKHLTNIREEVHKAGTIYRLGRFQGLTHEWEVGVAVTGMHNVQAAIETERMIEHFRPSVLFFSGVAGGLKDVSIGDVVAATKVYWYEPGKDEKEFKTRTEFGESSYPLVQRAMAVAQEGKWLERAGIGKDAQPPPKALVGPIAAGAKVIASHEAESYQLLRETFSDAVAVDMESFGFLRAVYSQQGTMALAVRGISDLVHDKAVADARGSQPMAASHAAAFAFQVLAELAPKQLDTGFIPTPQKISLAREQIDLEELAPSLYPRGPLDREVWSRAGGDVAQLHLGGSGKTDWHSALRLLDLGGGGANITRDSLIATMYSDFPNNTIFKKFS